MRLKRPCAAMMRLFCQINFITCYTINTASFSSWIWQIISLPLPLPFSYQWQLDCTECEDMSFVGQSYEIKMRRLGTICNNNEQQYRVSTISCIFIMRIELKVLPMIDWLIDWLINWLIDFSSEYLMSELLTVHGRFYCCIIWILYGSLSTSNYVAWKVQIEIYTIQHYLFEATLTFALRWGHTKSSRSKSCFSDHHLYYVYQNVYQCALLLAIPKKKSKLTLLLHTNLVSQSLKSGWVLKGYY